jgi:hypothetical protein
MRVCLVRDVLDKQLLDATSQNAGKVDGVVIELRPGEPARVHYVEVGPITLLRRLNRRFGDWFARIDARFGEGRGKPIRIPISRVMLESPALRLDLAVDGLPVMALERWLRRHVVAKIPWS